MNPQKIISIFSFLLFSMSSYAQIAPGQWRDLLPYNNYKKIIPVNNRVYCQTDNSLLYYDLNEQAYHTFSKVQGLSEVGISSIAYSASTNALIVGYASSNIDIIVNNEITNLPDIKNKIGVGNKTINNIEAINNYAYVCCGFGIVVIDLTNFNIKDTYYIGNGVTNLNVYDVCTSGTLIYAATSQGIFSASINDPYLENYAEWTQDNTLPSANMKYSNIQALGDNLYAILDSTVNVLYSKTTNSWSPSTLNGSAGILNVVVQNNSFLLINNSSINVYASNGSQISSYKDGGLLDACLAKDGSLWFIKSNELACVINGSLKKVIIVPGPWSVESFSLAQKNGITWISHGGYSGDIYLPSYNCNGFSFENSGTWQSLNCFTSQPFTNCWDIVQVALNPQNLSTFYLASMSGSNNGLIECTNFGKGINIYNSTNTQNAIQTNIVNKDGSLSYRIPGLSFDANNNLWISVQSSNPIVVMKPDKTFRGYSFTGNLAPSTSAIRGKILATSFGQIWQVISGYGLFIFNYNNTPDNLTDDSYQKISITVNNATDNTLYNFVYCMVEDMDGNIWLGTKNGPIVYSNPQSLITNPNMNANYILVPLNNGTNGANVLLQNETINAIAIDGANRKWIATLNSGVFLLSADGTKQLLNFRMENSPLFSNDVLDIAIDNVSGEVFFATNVGTVVYRGNATEGGSVFGDIYAYPNPVKEGYEGEIIITGLIANTDVKITDISGNLVYETTSLGGQAVWYGKNFAGQKVHTGVYLAFCVTSDGSQKHITKILFIH